MTNLTETGKAAASENDPNLINVVKVVDTEDHVYPIKGGIFSDDSGPWASSPSAETPAHDEGHDRDEERTQDDTAYVSRWTRSSKSKNILDEDDFDEERSSLGSDEQLLPIDELPPFSDEESKALHREIKLLEQRRDEAANADRSHKERIDIINDHLHSVRQDIDHTNSLVAAKKNEIETEEHLLYLSQRELGQYLRDTSVFDDDIIAKQKSISVVKSQIATYKEEFEKLRIDLNWNQEELEQWATAAAKKEEENSALQKYNLADELKIKELALTIEDLTKRSVEKKSMLENEVTETKSNQTELEKLAERFKSRHDERRQLIQQWKDTIESMNKRDTAVNELASQYAEFSQQEDECKKTVTLSRERNEILEVSLFCILPLCTMAEFF